MGRIHLSLPGMQVKEETRAECLGDSWESPGCPRGRKVKKHHVSADLLSFWELVIATKEEGTREKGKSILSTPTGK